jgi:hypothetical protein
MYSALLGSNVSTLVISATVSLTLAAHVQVPLSDGSGFILIELYALIYLTVHTIRGSLLMPTIYSFYQPYSV